MNKKIIYALVAVVVVVLCLNVIHSSTNNPLGAGNMSPPVPNYSTSTSYTITSSSTYVEATTTRTYYVFSNASPTGIWLQCLQGNAAANNQGILITASSTYEMSVQKGNACYGALRAISAGAANATLVVTGY